MKSGLSLALFALASCAAVPSQSNTPVPPPTPVNENRVTLYLGQRNLDEDDYSPVDEQGMVGLEYARETAGSALGFEIGVMGSKDDEDSGGLDIEGTTGEVYAGIHKTFGSEVVRPYLGAGLSYINSEVKVNGNSDNDGSAAGYAHVGLLFQVAKNFFFGADFRVLFGSDLEIAGVDTNADYGQLALTLGASF